MSAKMLYSVLVLQRTTEKLNLPHVSTVCSPLRKKFCQGNEVYTVGFYVLRFYSVYAGENSKNVVYKKT